MSLAPELIKVLSDPSFAEFDPESDLMKAFLLDRETLTFGNTSARSLLKTLSWILLPPAHAEARRDAEVDRVRKKSRRLSLHNPEYAQVFGLAGAMNAAAGKIGKPRVDLRHGDPAEALRRGYKTAVIISLKRFSASGGRRRYSPVARRSFPSQGV